MKLTFKMGASLFALAMIASAGAGALSVFVPTSGVSITAITLIPPAFAGGYEDNDNDDGDEGGDDQHDGGGDDDDDEGDGGGNCPKPDKTDPPGKSSPPTKTETDHCPRGEYRHLGTNQCVCNYGKVRDQVTKKCVPPRVVIKKAPPPVHVVVPKPIMKPKYVAPMACPQVESTTLDGVTLDEGQVFICTPKNGQTVCQTYAVIDYQ